jgi:regulator of sigma E protease
MSFVIFILLLIVLILVHEFGHFACAKLFGIKVEEFGIFFPPRLFAWKFGETEYSVNSIPMGGFVRIFGENDHEGVKAPRSFASKSRFVQAAVVVAGIVMNLAFAWLILSFGYMVGLPTAVDHEGFGIVQNQKVTIVGILPNSPAQGANITPGDNVIVVQAGGETMDTRILNTNHQADAVRNFIKTHQEDALTVTLENAGAQRNISLQAVSGLVSDRKALGVELEDVGVLQLPLHLALLQGAILTKNFTVLTATGLSGFFIDMVHGALNWNGIAGPIGIVSLGSHIVSQGFASAVELVATISISLALFNVIPIPGLDGGRLLFIAIEGIRGKALSKRLSLGLTVVGFALLITLMLVVSYHDIARLIG